MKSRCVTNSLNKTQDAERYFAASCCGDAPGLGLGIQPLDFHDWKGPSWFARLLHGLSLDPLSPTVRSPCSSLVTQPRLRIFFDFPLGHKHPPTPAARTRRVPKARWHSLPHRRRTHFNRIASSLVHAGLILVMARPGEEQESSFDGVPPGLGLTPQSHRIAPPPLLPSPAGAQDWPRCFLAPRALRQEALPSPHGRHSRRRCCCCRLSR